jgi:hypothetical protein
MGSRLNHCENGIHLELSKIRPMWHVQRLQGRLDFREYDSPVALSEC